MTRLPKIEIGHNAIRKKAEIGEFIELIFPGNPNQQYAALAMVLELKWSGVAGYQGLKWIKEKHCIPSRIFERTREKLNKVGILEHATNLSGRTENKHGWQLSSRFANSLRLLAGKYVAVIQNKERERCKRDFAELNYIPKKY